MDASALTTPSTLVPKCLLSGGAISSEGLVFAKRSDSGERSEPGKTSEKTRGVCPFIFRPFNRAVALFFAPFPIKQKERLYAPTQFRSVASKVSPSEHSQAKLPRVLRQIPFLHKPGNLEHSSISAKETP